MLFLSYVILFALRYITFLLNNMFRVGFIWTNIDTYSTLWSPFIVIAEK